jgi:hypothetical protein
VENILRKSNLGSLLDAGLVAKAISGQLHVVIGDDLIPGDISLEAATPRKAPIALLVARLDRVLVVSQNKHARSGGSADDIVNKAT